jgi:macrolide transport system ATP-binding/permease protein
MQGALHSLDPGMAIYDPMTMDEKIHDAPSTYLHRSSAWLVGGFALSALLLGVVGLYGVIAYSVSQRTREIGVRMALGAERASVYRLVLTEAGQLIVIGLLAGLALSVGAAMLIRKLLFGVKAWDIPTLIGVSIMLAMFAVLASYLPARRAASVSPAEALRTE